MKEQIDILEVLTGKKKLKKASLDSLLELGTKYPYSSPVDVLINKKHLKDHGTLSLLQMATLVSKMNNPGLALTSVIEGATSMRGEKEMKNNESSGSVKKKKAKKKKAKKNIKAEGSLGLNIVSEQLAEIYLKQGMKKEAIKMYKRLSLQNPKKSAYFAKILKKINK